MAEFRYRDDLRKRKELAKTEWPFPKKVGVAIAVILGIPLVPLVLLVLWMVLMEFIPFLAPR